MIAFRRISWALLLLATLSLPAALANAAAPPTITSVSPSSGADTIDPYPTITGTGFESGAKVDVGGVAARGVWQTGGSSEFIVFQPPLASHTGAVNVRVVNPDGGTAVLVGGFTYTTASIAPPVIGGISPNSGADTMSPYPTISGSNLQAGAKVYVGGVAVRGVWGQTGGGTTALAFEPPLASHTGAVAVEVVNPNGGYAILAKGFTYTKASLTPPVITSISPNSGPYSLSPYPTISGSNFESGAKVYLGGVVARGVWGQPDGGTNYLVFEPPLVGTIGPVSVEVINPNHGYAILKDGFTYTSTTTSPVNGACGSANGTSVSTAPTSDLCSTGTASALSGSGPWIWSCAGADGGTTASCSAKLSTTSAVNGVCGSANGTSVSTAPTSNLCGTGTPSAVTGTGPFAWSCAGANGGSTASCSAKLSTSTGVNGVCGPANGTLYTTAPTSGLCATGTASALSGAGPWGWTCAGAGGGTTADCSAEISTTTSGADNYPHIASFAGGGPQTYDSTFQSYAAKFYLVVIDGYWEGWEQQNGYSKQSVINSIKKQSTVATRVFQYVDLNEGPTATSGAADPTYLNKVNSMNWWLYNVGTSGTMTTSSFNAAWGLVNMTVASPLANGLGPYEWGATYVNNLYHLGDYAGTSAAPSLDGFFLDNVFWEPSQSADWARNGTTQSLSDPTTGTNFRAGEKTFYDEMKVIFPSGVQIGNIATWGNASGGAGTVSPLNGALGGGLMESAIGESYSVETWAYGAGLQQWYQFTMNNIAVPQYVILAHDNVTATGSDDYGPGPQAMRYGIAAALMNNGYYWANTSQAYSDAPAACLWFDEYDGGGIGVGYLGQPLATAAGAVQTAAWSNGVWKREFANGIVLWSPNVSGGGSLTVSLSGLGNLKHLSGTEPSNDGSTVTGGTVTLNNRDGMILLRY